jgi:hypothetical protein
MAHNGGNMQDPNIMLSEIHPKDVSKPEKYGGDTTKWKLWSGAMRTWLKTKHWQWGGLLDEVKKRSTRRFTPEVEEELWQALKISNWEVRNQLKEQLHRYLA